jgi:hypothetical protein|tara:strand:+ start:333 stop:512 length:180 start_codon:yes stop_codon:yes gene_type:complete
MKKLNSKTLRKIILEEVKLIRRQQLNEAGEFKQNKYIIQKVDALETKIDLILKLLKGKK